MNTYLQSIIITTAGCHLVLMTAAELGSENARKNLRFLCGLIVLLTLFSPLHGFLENLNNALDTLLTAPQESVDSSLEDARSAAATESAYAYVAEKWITYLTENYDINREQIQILIHTSDREQIESVDIILSRCPYAIRRKAEKDLSALMDFPVVIKGE